MSNKESFNSLFLIVLIVAFAFAIRLYQIQNVPPGFFCDEAIRGVDAYSLTTTGRDSHGERFPIFFKVFSEYTPPFQTYSEILPILLLGLSETSVRLTSVLYGVVSVFLIYLLASRLLSKRIGLISALMLALAPWSLHYSRTGFEYNCYFVFFLLSLFFWLKGIKRARYFLVSCIFWGLTFYTYNPAKLIVLVFLVALIIISRKRLLADKKIFFISLSSFLIISFPSILHIFSGQGLIRYNQVSIFTNDSSIKEIILKMLQNYFYHYSPVFLFFNGDPNAPNNRHFSLGLSPLLITTLPFLLIGTIWFFISKRIPLLKKKIIFLWMLVYPLSGAFTSIISTNRAMIGVGLFSLLTALGLDLILAKIARFKITVIKILSLTAIFSVLIINFFSFYHFYLRVHALKTADFWGWQYGPREIMRYFLQVKDSYDDLYMSGEFNEGQIFLKFYDPKNTCKNKCKIADFWRAPEIVELSRQQLFSLSPEYLDKSSFKNLFLIKKKIFYPDGKIAFLIGSLGDLSRQE